LNELWDRKDGNADYRNLATISCNEQGNLSSLVCLALGFNMTKTVLDDKGEWYERRLEYKAK
jgi:hypothetical protein